MQHFIEVHNHSNGIVEVKINRPDKKNALSFAMLKQLIKIGEAIKKQKETRLVLLTGIQECFSAGIDLIDLRDKKNRWTAAWEFIKPGVNIFQKVSLVWQEIPVPVIAVIEGYCFGAGMQLALGADFRIAHPNAKLSIMEAKWGLIPDMGITKTLRGLMHLDKVKELAMTAKIVSAIEAKELGLVTYTAQNPMEKALELANELIAHSPDALVGIKRVFNSMEADSPSKSLRWEKVWQRKIIMGKNSKIAVKKEKDSTIKFLPRQFD